MSPGRRVAVDVVLAAAISFALALLVLGPLLALLDRDWFISDMLTHYVGSQTWSVIDNTVTTHYGYPFGMDNNYFSVGDYSYALITHGIELLTGSPFVGVNLVILLSFPVAAALAIPILRMARLRGPVAVAFAVAIAMLPFHWVRALHHSALSTTISLLTGLLIVLLIASGRLTPMLLEGSRRSRIWSFLGVAGLVVVTGLSGVYYAMFTLILASSAVVLAFARALPWRHILVSGVVIVSLGLLVGLGQVPSLLARSSGVPFTAIAERMPVESTWFSGALIAALIPGPISGIPGYGGWISDIFTEASNLENTLASNFGTLVTTACLLIFLGTLIMRSRRGQALSPSDPSGITPGVVGWLIVTTLLFFIPWGLNFAFAVLVTPQIRSWNRLLPVLLILFILGAVTVLRDSPRLHAGRVPFLTACLIVLVTALDVVVPTAAGFAATVKEYVDVTDRARAYNAQLNEAIPGDCAVLQLPLGTYPEPDGRYAPLLGYQHLWQGLVNPDKRWSYGAVKRTSASAWQDQIDEVPTDEQVAFLAQAGFCAIHLDQNAFEEEDLPGITAELAARFGAPVAVDRTDGWVAWRLPNPQPIRPPAQWPADVQAFFGYSG